MKSFQILGLTLLLAVGCQSSRVASAQQTEAAKPAAVSKSVGAFARLQGIWVAEKVTSASKVVPDEKFSFEIHFEPPDQMIFKFVSNAGGRERTGRDRLHTITFDDSKSPANMNITRIVARES